MKTNSTKNLAKRTLAAALLGSAVSLGSIALPAVANASYSSCVSDARAAHEAKDVIPNRRKMEAIREGCCVGNGGYLVGSTCHIPAEAEDVKPPDVPFTPNVVGTAPDVVGVAEPVEPAPSGPNVARPRPGTVVEVMG